ncbi:LLM class flavin-dependent oxidoreductase [Streptomyces huiliensis]|uniref:LLM class flavin-dependent oxidoreductase n=1 Tax=Streptomyces huiliensis TaxID=2876027 RepID=UPI001CBDF67A|nr:LLM class flavin-dependent oxidoreductase [Streptomyces huiliensis]MBZ4323747.1 LLM class flavin-dependent oxidoreductase [Streptomyces huiliensis]
MDFGLTFFPALDERDKAPHDYFDDCLALAVDADRLGYEHVQVVEHHLGPYGGYSPDPVVLLSAIAARTERLRITTGAVIPAFDHPLKLAGRLAMLDQLSGGRVDVGVGRAFLPHEFTAFEVSMEESRARFTEALRAFVALWTGTDVVFEGEFHRFGPVTLTPRPHQTPHPPLFVASASSAESCAAAGREGHNLQIVPTITSGEQFAEMLAAYREAFAAHHPDRAPRIQVKYSCYLDRDRDSAWRAAEAAESNYLDKMSGAVKSWQGAATAQYPGYEKLADKVASSDLRKSWEQDKVLIGTTADITEQLERVRERVGGDVTVSLHMNNGVTPLEQARWAVAEFATEIAPRFATV